MRISIDGVAFCIPESSFDEPFYKVLNKLDYAHQAPNGNWYRAGKPNVVLHIASKEYSSKELALDPTCRDWKSP